MANKKCETKSENNEPFRFGKMGRGSICDMLPKEFFDEDVIIFDTQGEYELLRKKLGK